MKHETNEPKGNTMSNPNVVLLVPSYSNFQPGVGGVPALNIYWLSPDGGGQFILEKSTDFQAWDQAGTWNPSGGGAQFNLDQSTREPNTAYRMRYVTRAAQPFNPPA